MQRLQNSIRKESIEMQYNGKADGLQLQQEFADWCRTVLNPSIENILEQYENNDELISFDKISIDIELSKTSDWKNVLGKKIVNELREKIRSTGMAEVRTHKSYREYFAETLSYFLRHGILPWNSSIRSKEDFVVALEQWVAAQSPEELDPVLVLMQEQQCRNRFVSLINEKSFSKLIVLVAGEQQALSIERLMNDLETIADQSAVEYVSMQKHLKQLKETVVVWLSKHRSLPALDIILKQWLQKAADDFQMAIQHVDVTALKQPELKKIVIQKQLDRGKQGESEIPAMEQASVETGNPIPDIPVSTESKTAFSAIAAEGIFINNAGAVIIAPFLPALFERCGLLDQYEITNNAAAIGLLSYCISADTNPAEFELLLPKILCGADPERYVTVEPPQKRMLEEAEQMLASVIEYWAVLKDTSIDGLRKGFIQRNGKLSFAKDEWLLQVEQQSYDMLLQQLPWNISMIKLPWMQHLLRTEWI